MRTGLTICVLLCGLNTSLLAAKPGKDDTVHTVKRRTLVSAKGDASIEVTRHVAGGITTTTVERRGLFGRQETKWMRDGKGTLIRKTIAGMRMVDGRPDHYFVGTDVERTGLSKATLATVNHTAQHAAASPPHADAIQNKGNVIRGPWPARDR